MSFTKEAQALSHSDFWNERYAAANEETPTHEWFRGFEALESFFEKYLFNGRKEKGKDERILHLGSGDSTISYYLLDRAYTNQLCVDFSNVAFDKGTLDAMIYGSPWSPPDEVLENSGKYISEVSRDRGIKSMQTSMAEANTD